MTNKKRIKRWRRISKIEEECALSSKNRHPRTPTRSQPSTQAPKWTMRKKEVRLLLSRTILIALQSQPKKRD